MAAIPGINILLWMLLWGALIRTIEIKYHDAANPLGSAARALQVIW